MTMYLNKGRELELELKTFIFTRMKVQSKTEQLVLAKPQRSKYKITGIICMHIGIMSE